MKIKARLFLMIITAVTALSLSMPCCLAENNNDSMSLKPKNKIEKKQEAKNVLGKFLTTMLWVGGSCIVIFMLLLAYKRLKNTPIVNPKQIDIEKNLNTPDTVEEAAKFVIEKF